MKVFADLHIHSRYSRATSSAMDVENLVPNAEKKGLTLLGTGDFTHPLWLEELRGLLKDEAEVGIFTPPERMGSKVRFLLTGEVCTNFEFEGRRKRIHHLLLAPSLDCASQINDRLSRFGDLEADGRPNLDMSAAELVEEIRAVSDWNEVIPAHVWTPWFSLFGAFSGFDSLVSCYQELSGEIHALETGLSSDPPMNWRLSELDNYVLVSNSDSHSPWTWRLGREANIFEVEELNYQVIVGSIRRKDKTVLKGTVEVNPAYGKYHWTGHRKCMFSVPPEKAVELNNLCPVCHKRLTKGVGQRVLELSDRPSGFIPENGIPFISLLPLSEIIASVTGSSSLYASSVQEIHTKLVMTLGNEFEILLDAGREEIARIAGNEIAETVVAVRNGEVDIVPGYDGVYGQLVVPKTEETAVTDDRQNIRIDASSCISGSDGRLDKYL